MENWSIITKFHSKGVHSIALPDTEINRDSARSRKRSALTKYQKEVLQYVINYSRYMVQLSNINKNNGTTAHYDFTVLDSSKELSN